MKDVETRAEQLNNKCERRETQGTFEWPRWNASAHQGQTANLRFNFTVKKVFKILEIKLEFDKNDY